MVQPQQMLVQLNAALVEPLVPGSLHMGGCAHHVFVEVLRTIDLNQQIIRFQAKLRKLQQRATVQEYQGLLAEAFHEIITPRWVQGNIKRLRKMYEHVSKPEPEGSWGGWPPRRLR